MTDEKKPLTMEEEYNKDGAKRAKWAAFVESTLADFYSEHDFEKMTVEDGNGNKARFSRVKDGIKVEHSSTTML